MCGRGRRPEGDGEPTTLADGSVAGQGVSEIHGTVIRCTCGHRILRKDVIQTGLYLSIMGPGYVYVRFRCGRCRRVGEHLVPQTEWDPSVLEPAAAKCERVDEERFAEMGDISPEEVIEFHYALERLTADPEEET